MNRASRIFGTHEDPRLTERAGLFSELHRIPLKIKIIMR